MTGNYDLNSSAAKRTTTTTAVTDEAAYQAGPRPLDQPQHQHHHQQLIPPLPFKKADLIDVNFIDLKNSPPALLSLMDKHDTSNSGTTASSGSNHVGYVDITNAGGAADGSDQMRKNSLLLKEANPFEQSFLNATSRPGTMANNSITSLSETTRVPYIMTAALDSTGKPLPSIMAGFSRNRSGITPSGNESFGYPVQSHGLAYNGGASGAFIPTGGSGVYMPVVATPSFFNQLTPGTALNGNLASPDHAIATINTTAQNMANFGGIPMYNQPQGTRYGQQDLQQSQQQQPPSSAPVVASYGLSATNFNLGGPLSASTVKPQVSHSGFDEQSLPGTSSSEAEYTKKSLKKKRPSKASSVISSNDGVDDK